MTVGKMAASIKNKLKLICRISVYDSVRQIHTSGYLQNDVMKSKTMKKIMKKANRKKDTKWYGPVLEQPSIFNTSTGGKPFKAKRKFSEGMQRRAGYVSEVLYDSISQIVGSGELGVSASVTQVKVIPDMAHMNIYWECSGDTEKDDQTQIALTEKVKSLRHNLIQAQTVGNVPRPIFVKDLSIAKQRQVDELLHKISLENQASTDDTELNSHGKLETTHKNDSDVSPQQNLSTSSHENTEDMHIDTDENLDDDRANYRQDIYGLQHDVLMKKVVLAKKTAIQRPSIVSTKESRVDNFRNVDLKMKTKFLSSKKPLSKNKLIRQFELEDDYDLKSARVKYNEDELSNDAGNEKEMDEDYSAIDEYIEKYSKERS